MRALPADRPKSLTAPADGQTLEGIIGDLQSQYGVPQYPQEYRITIKVGEEREGRPETVPAESAGEPLPSKADGPKREKAPAPPALMRSESSSPSGSRRRRGRRRKKRGGGGGSSSGGSSTG